MQQDLSEVGKVLETHEDSMTSVWLDAVEFAVFLGSCSDNWGGSSWSHSNRRGSLFAEAM